MSDISLIMFDPSNWFWIADDGRVFNSANKIVTNTDDEDFQQWLNDGFKATRWPEDDEGNQTDAALDTVLRPYGLSCFPEALSDLKAFLKAEIDTAAELERLKYITPGVGQAMTYQQKVEEARAFKAASNPQASDYPVLASEIGITAQTLAEVADIVLAAFAQWQQIGAMIESIRLGAKRDIDAAENEAAAREIADAIIWPSEQVLA
ncbi:MAG: hypothetical protein PBV01_24340 [Brucella anthropi]